MSKSNLQLKLERTHLLKFPSCCYRSSRYSEQAKQDISLIMGPHKLMNRKRESTSNKPSATCICLTFNRTQHSHGTLSHLAQDFCPCFCQMFHHFLLITRGYVGRIFQTLTIWEGQTLCCNYCPQEQQEAVNSTNPADPLTTLPCEIHWEKLMFKMIELHQNKDYTKHIIKTMEIRCWHWQSPKNSGPRYGCAHKHCLEQELSWLSGHQNTEQS